ncbi:MAG: enoyl-CoA hydratase/isomerase family protein [Burkholderiales bacterium]|nr:enoyl-CoA hydratase/isomerase family protein [Burkholderiales bacterium]
MSTVLVERQGSACVLTLNRPEALNALTSEMLECMLATVDALDADPEVRALVIAGAGEKGFCAGIDLKQRSALPAAGKMAQSRMVLRLNQALWHCSKPVIAAIGGWCMGAGFELALHCDLRIAADDARFAFPEMTLGAYPGGGGAVMLPRLIGAARAKDLLFSARRPTAAEALALGIVERVVPRGELLAAALAFAAGLDATAPLAVAALKKSINQGLEAPLAAAFELDQALRRPLDATRDYEEGIRAHLEKRKPQFRGE